MRSLFTLAIALYAFSAHESFAGSYYPISLQADDVSWVDLDSMKMNGSTAKAWVLDVRFKPTVLEGKSYDYALNDFVIDCSSDTITVPEELLYKLPNEVVTSYDDPIVQPHAIAPDTMAAGLEKVACHPEAKPTRSLNVMANRLVVVSRSLKADGSLAKIYAQQ